MQHANTTITSISLDKRGKLIVLDVRLCGTHSSTYFTLHIDDVKWPNLRFWAHREHTNVNLLFFFFTLKPLVSILFLGHFAQIVRRKRDGIIAKDVRLCNYNSHILWWRLRRCRHRRSYTPQWLVEVSHVQRKCKRLVIGLKCGTHCWRDCRRDLFWFSVVHSGTPTKFGQQCCRFLNRFPKPAICCRNKMFR